MRHMMAVDARHSFLFGLTIEDTSLRLLLQSDYITYADTLDCLVSFIF